jgi:multiple sugar transport system ATP-binding protein
MNLLEATANGAGTALVDGYELPIPRDAAALATTGRVTVGIRPEAWRLAVEGEEGYPVSVTVTEELGADAYLYATPAASGAESVLHQVVARVPGRLALQKGETVRLVPDPALVAVFDPLTGVRLSA